MTDRTVGFVGLGCLGRPMAERLVSQGFRLHVYNRTPAKAQELARRGAVVSDDPAGAAAEASVVITVVGDDAALRDVVLGPKGISSSLRPGATHIEMSTVSRETTLELAEAAASRGGRFLDAPVLGSGPQAREGQLIVMIGGSKDVLEANRPLLESLAIKIVHTGDIGKASDLKLVANQFIASMMVGFAQGMLLAQKAGISPEMVVDILDASALRSPFYSGKLERLRTRDFTPNFPLRWMLKDIDLILKAGARLGVPLPAVAAARELYVSAVSQGLGELDYSAVVETLEQASGMDLD